MSGQQNVFVNNGLQMPMFTGVSAQNGQTKTFANEYELSDVFADYFVNELEEPFNSYHQMLSTESTTSHVANPLQTATPVSQGYTQASNIPVSANTAVNVNAGVITTEYNKNVSVTLPTRRGIKTAWHSGNLPSLQGTLNSGNSNHQQQQSLAHIAKKLKPENHVQQVYQNSNINLPAQAHLQQTQHQRQQQSTAASSLNESGSAPFQSFQPIQSATNASALASNIGKDHTSPAVSSNTPTPHSAVQNPNSNNVTLSAGSGISGRLGFSMVGGQLSLPQQKNSLNLQGMSIQTKQSQDLNATAQQQGTAVISATGGITLPVGIGIKVGGQTGAVHGADTNSASGANAEGVKSNSSVWGGQGIWSSTGLLGLEHGRGGLSEQVVAERRQRNREHAKRSRVRKKFLLESLQEQVRSLQKENVGLRMLVYEVLPQKAQTIIRTCCKQSPLFSDNTNANDVSKNNEESANNKKNVELVRSDYSLIESLSTGQQNFVLSDPRLPDNPVVFASEGFYTLTGYTREQVLGRNCRFLQGPGTDPKALDVIRTAIANGTDATACFLNYKADGTPFWNQFFVAALRDADNNIVNYVGVQCAVEPDAGTSVLEDKVNSVMPLVDKDEEKDEGQT